MPRIETGRHFGALAGLRRRPIVDDERRTTTIDDERRRTTTNAERLRRLPHSPGFGRGWGLAPSGTDTKDVRRGTPSHAPCERPPTPPRTTNMVATRISLWHRSGMAKSLD